jgi:hypothetical protein
MLVSPGLADDLDPVAVLSEAIVSGGELVADADEAAIVDRDLAEGLRTFLAVHRELRPILEALAEFSLDLDGHIQHLIDVARGK